MPKKIKLKKRKQKNLEANGKKDRLKLIDRVKKSNLFSREQVVIKPPNEKEKMSEVLLDFAEPLLDEAKSDKEKRTAIAISTLIWNASLLPEREQTEAIEKACYDLAPSKNATDVAIFMHITDMLLERKKKYFPSIDRMIVDYQISETQGSLHLDVVSTTNV